MTSDSGRHQDDPLRRQRRCHVSERLRAARPCGRSLGIDGGERTATMVTHDHIYAHGFHPTDVAHWHAVPG